MLSVDITNPLHTHTHAQSMRASVQTREELEVRSATGLARCATWVERVTALLGEPLALAKTDETVSPSSARRPSDTR